MTLNNLFIVHNGTSSLNLKFKTIQRILLCIVIVVCSTRHCGSDRPSRRNVSIATSLPQLYCKKFVTQCLNIAK